MKQQKIKLISVGWGSSGYYSPRTLQLAETEQAFGKGTQLHWNHPTRDELEARPERDLNTLAGVTVESAKYIDDPVHGKGLYANSIIYSDFEDRVIEKAHNLSILAYGIKKQGEAPTKEGTNRKGLIVERIIPSPLNTVDFVTKAGAGGKLIFESSRELEENNYLLSEDIRVMPTDKDNDMELQEQLTSVQEKLDQLQVKYDALVIEKAINTVLADEKLADLPQYVKDILVKVVKPELTESNEVDTDKLLASMLTEAQPFIEAIPTKNISFGTGSLVTNSNSSYDVLAAEAKAIRENQ